MIEVYKVKVSVEDSNSSNVTTKYFMTLEKASEYLEEQREYYFDDYSTDSESDSESESSYSDDEDDEYVEESKEYREETKESIENERSADNGEDKGDDDSEDSDYPDEEITVEFLSSLFEEDNYKFRPHTVFEHYIDEEYITASISKIFINN